MTYKILHHNRTADLEAMVTRYIADGWLPYGPLVHASPRFYQAMIRLDDKAKYAAAIAKIAGIF